MAATKKPSGLRPKGFAGFDEESIAKLAEKIAEFQSYIPTEPPESLRSLGYTRFLEDRQEEIDYRGKAVALFGADRCAGCRFLHPRVGTAWFGECRRNSPGAKKWPDVRVFDWCGRHEPIIGGA